MRMIGVLKANTSKKNRHFWQQFGENVFCIKYEEVAIISAATDVNKLTPLSLSQCGH